MINDYVSFSIHKCKPIGSGHLEIGSGHLEIGSGHLEIGSGHLEYCLSHNNPIRVEFKAS